MSIKHEEKYGAGSGGLFSVIDNILLLACGIVIATRCQISETLPVEAPGLSGAGELSHAGAAVMVIFAGAIMATTCIWLSVRLFRGAIRWRRTSLGWPLVLMAAAGAVSTTFASNKYTALVGTVNLLSQMVLAMLLVQLLNRRWKQRLLLGVLAAAGVTMAYRCWEQYHYELPELVQEYEKNPEKILIEQGFEPGSYPARQYAARLKSQDVGGYFLISNTAAAFFILSIMATLAVLLDMPIRNLSTRQQYLLIGVVLVLLAQIAGLLITRSKGGIGGWAAAMILLLVLWAGRKILGRFWRATIITAGVLTIAVMSAMVWYGMQHGRLPTLSLWVRWQYWQAGGAMIADHWLCGVGAENFGTHYTYYMQAAAPEVVKDPHSLPLALWSQWGLLGLIGFVWALPAVAVRLVRPRLFSSSADIAPAGSSGTPRHWWFTGLVLIIATVFIRWLVSDLSQLNPTEVISIFVIFFLIPAVIWMTAFVLTQAWGQPGEESHPADEKDRCRAIVPLVLGCGLLGFLLHNSIDFAIFQPGPGTCFFAMIAAALAIRQQEADGVFIHVARRFPARLGILLVIIATVVGLSVLATRAGSAEYFMSQAREDFLLAETWARQAAWANRWDPGPCYWAGRRWQWRWYQSQRQDAAAFEQARQWLQRARERDPAHFRYYRQLSELYLAAAEQAEGDRKIEYLAQARLFGEQALERYPIKSELLIHMGRLLMDYGELLKWDDWHQEALDLFEKALAGEQAFMDQQRQMYPGRDEYTPRLPVELQNEARERINKLKETRDKT